MLEIAPIHKRGRYFAIKDSVAGICTAALSLTMGKVLDACAAAGRARDGYSILFSLCLVLARVDAALMLRMSERSHPLPQKVKFCSLLSPLRDARYRPVLLYFAMWYFSTNLAGPFQSVYLLQGLGLSHSFITAVGLVAAFAGIAGALFWGKIADQADWRRVLLIIGGILSLVHLGWFGIRPGSARGWARVLLILIAACNSSFLSAGLNMQYALSPPEDGATWYLGVTAAVSFAASYCAALLSSAAQPVLAAGFGERSIAILYLASAVCCGLTVLYGVFALPRSG